MDNTNKMSILVFAVYGIIGVINFQLALNENDIWYMLIAGYCFGSLINVFLSSIIMDIQHNWIMRLFNWNKKLVKVSEDTIVENIELKRRLKKTK